MYAQCEINGLKYSMKEVGKNISSTKVYHRWEFNLYAQKNILEFWDSKLSGKKKVALNGRIIYFNQFDEDIIFGMKFTLGYNNLEIKQYGEDRYYLFINGYRFQDIMAQEKIEKKNLINKKEREKQKQKKMEDDYYKRALKYNGNDYYEGKEKVLLNNNQNNQVNNNINNNNNKYSYEQYKKKRSKTMNNNNYNYPPNNNYNYLPNNNYNYPPNNYYNQNQPNINNNNKYNQYYEKEEEPKYNNNYQNEEANNPYPSFSQYLNTENNAGYNNKMNLNNDNYNYYYDNNRNNNNKNKNNNLMNQIEEVFTNEKNQNQNFNKRSTIDLPTYSEILAPQNNNQNQPSQNKINNNKKNNTESDNLINYIGNLNKKGKSSIKPIPEDNNNNNGYNFGFEDDENDYKINDSNQIELNIYNHEQIDKERNKKKMFVNKSSFKNPLNEEDYDMENPYNNY